MMRLFRDTLDKDYRETYTYVIDRCGGYWYSYINDKPAYPDKNWTDLKIRYLELLRTNND